MDRKRIVVIGVGSIGERHLRCFLATGRVSASLVELNPRLADEVAQRYDVPVAASIDEALAQRPDAAVICTPAPFHIPQARQFAEAGIHVLIEKPLSTSLDGVAELREVVRRRGVTAAVAYVLRGVPLVAALREALQSGRFGAPKELIAVCGQHFPTYRPAYRDIYYKDRRTGGGAIQDALTHIINLGEWLVGPVERLVADAAHQALPGVEVEDTVHVLTRQGGALGSYSLNQYQAPNETTLTVVCEQGTVRLDFHHNRWLWMTTPGNAWHAEDFPAAERDTAFVDQAHAFLDAVEGKRPVACTLEEGWQTLRVNLAALASLETGRWVNLDAEDA